MIPISKEEAEYLKQVGAIRMERGKFPDIVITSREKSAKRKNRQVAELPRVVKALKEFREQK